MSPRISSPPLPGTEDGPAGSAAITTSGLSKRFDTGLAVDGLDIVVPPASVAAFVGPNGSGKTTTIRMLLGLVAPTSGAGYVLGEPIDKPQRYLPRVGALIEGPAFYPSLSGRANLEVLRALGRHPASRVAEVLSLVGLSHRAGDKVSKYSMGMKQRLGIAAALLANPSLLVLDEPVNGLDPSGIAAVRLLLRRLADAGTTVLVSSHQLAELQHIADWVIMIDDGRLQYQGTLEQLLAHASHVQVKPENHADLDRLARLLREAGHQVADSGSEQSSLVVVPKDGSASDINRLASSAGIVLAELRTASGSLEQAYFDITSRPSDLQRSPEP